jgi:SAM-dependent methyltransferase
MPLHGEATASTSTLSDARTDRRRTELSPALCDLLETFIPPGSRCLNVGRASEEAVGAWLLDHGCAHLGVAASQATALPHKDESFDAALLLDVLDQLEEPQGATTELHRVLRPGGVLVVTAPNAAYWRHRLDQATPQADDPGAGTVRPNSLRRLLLQSGFNLVGVQGQEGAFIGELPLAGRLWKGRASRPYRAAERLFPSLLGARVGAFAIRV